MLLFLLLLLLAMMMLFSPTCFVVVRQCCYTSSSSSPSALRDPPKKNIFVSFRETRNFYQQKSYYTHRKIKKASQQLDIGSIGREKSSGQVAQSNY